MAVWSTGRTAVLLLSVVLSHTSASDDAPTTVPPVTNVTLDCRNFQNILYWNYSHAHSLKPRFRVDIRPYTTGQNESLWVDYPNLQCNLSSFMSDENYVVSVTALVVGLKESLSAPEGGLCFSYFSYMSFQCEVMCSLDLPSVNVTVQSEVGIKFSFSHPSVVYSHKLVTDARRRRREAEDEELTMFKYDVMVTSDKTTYPFTCETDVCEESVAAKLGQERYCVQIDGEWDATRDLEAISVHGTKDYCAQAIDSNRGFQALYIALGLSAFILICSGLMMYYLKSICTFSLPANLNFSQTDKTEHSSQAPLILNRPSMSPVSPVAFTPDATFQDPAEEDKPMIIPVTITARAKGPEPRLPIGGLPPLGESAPAPPGDDPAAGDAGRGSTNGPEQPDVGVDEWGVQSPSGYEQRDRVVTTVEIAHGDRVDAYHS